MVEFGPGITISGGITVGDASSGTGGSGIVVVLYPI